MSIYSPIVLEAMLPFAALCTTLHDAQMTKNTFLMRILLRSVLAGCRRTKICTSKRKMLKIEKLEKFLF